MVILPGQAGVALGLVAFVVASLAGIISGVTLEVAILRGASSFLVFLAFGWLMAYLIYDEGKTDSSPEDDTTMDNLEIKQNPKEEAAEDSETENLKPPEDIDF